MDKKIYFGMVFLCLLLMSGCKISQSSLDCKADEEYIVTDVVQVSAGGGGHSDKCLIMTDKGKLNLEGRVCNVQIGDKIYRDLNFGNPVCSGQLYEYNAK